MMPEKDDSGTQIRVTDDGSHTLYVPSLDEHYHSHFGALTESRHIFIQSGLEYIKSDHVTLLEAGFGTGLNALLTALFAEERKIDVDYTALEKYPLPEELTDQLNYPAMMGEQGKEIFTQIHSCGWNTKTSLSEYFSLTKKISDLTCDTLRGSFDLIYFDAFGPDKQPEMWTPAVFEKISAVCHPGTVFVTYSAKGTLKRMLRALNFEVTLLPGPPGKRVMTRAVKK